MYSYIKHIGNSIYLTKYDEKGKKYYIKDNKFKPYIFIESKVDTGYKTFLDNKIVSKIYFDIDKFRENLIAYPKELIYGNIGKGLIEIEKIREERLAEHYDLANLEVFYFDIEVFSKDGFPEPNKAEHPITVITIKSKKENKFYLWSITNEFNPLLAFKKDYVFFKDYNSFKEISNVIFNDKFKDKYNINKKEKERQLKLLEKKLLNEKILMNYLYETHFYLNSEKFIYESEKEYLKTYIEKNSDLSLNDEEKNLYIKEYVKKLEDIITEESDLKRLEKVKRKDELIINLEIKIDKLKEELKTSYRLYENFDKFSKIESRTFNDERSMLNDFVLFLGKSNVDVICGWNSSRFDIPYIYNRGKKLLGKNINNMSPFKVLIDKRLKEKNGDIIKSCEIVGINHIDYMDLYKSFIEGGRESFSLNSIASLEIGLSKINYTDEGNIHDLWLKNKQKYIEYNIRDTELVELIDKKTGYIDLAHSLCYYTCSPLDYYNSKTFLWTAKLFNELLDNKQALPSTSKNDGEKILGGYVKKPNNKLHGWVISFDLASLYPSLIRQYNLSHETFIEKHNINLIEKIIAGKYDFTKWKDKNQCFLPLGSVFSKEKKGILPQLEENLYKLRSKHKKESFKYFDEGNFVLANKLNNIQNAEKILLNSLYGALLYSKFILYKKEIGESITSMGQTANRYCSERLNLFFNETLKTNDLDYIIYGDTDSVASDSVVRTSLGKMKIKDLFDNAIGEIELRNENNIIKHLTQNVNCLSLNNNTKDIENKKIKYIMKHKVKKRMFLIKVDGKEVKITEDHSIIVERKGKIVSSKPSDIKKGDKLITINDYLENDINSKPTAPKLGYKKINQYNNKCILCDKKLGWFYDNKNKIAEFYNVTPFKTEDKNYFRQVCIDCFIKEFNEIPSSRWPKYDHLSFLLQIDKKILNKHHKKYNSVTIESMTRKYGGEEGIKRFNEYCEKQRYTNTFEYKNKKYGWDIEDFDNFNKKDQ